MGKVRLSDMQGDSPAAKALREHVREAIIRSNREVGVLVGELSMRDVDLFLGPVMPGRFSSSWTPGRPGALS